jgi:hypothetical protein
MQHVRLYTFCFACDHSAHVNFVCHRLDEMQLTGDINQFATVIKFDDQNETNKRIANLYRSRSFRSLGCRSQLTAFVAECVIDEETDIVFGKSRQRKRIIVISEYKFEHNCCGW